MNVTRPLRVVCGIEIRTKTLPHKAHSHSAFSSLQRLPAQLMQSLFLIFFLVSGYAVSGQNENIVYNFGILTNVMGFRAYAPLAQGPDGTLYGVTQTGEGVVSSAIFKISPDGTGYTALKQITNGMYGVDGMFLYGGLTLSGNTLYGAAYAGGYSGGGTLYKINTDGTGYTNIHIFASFPGDGGAPYYTTLAAAGSTLYGTTSVGGTNGFGIVFKINNDGTAFTILHSFTNTDGQNPYAGVILSGTNLYGTTEDGGNAGYGTVFKLSTNGIAYKVLHSFTNVDGQYPECQLLLSGTTLYGTTYQGGTNGTGTIFKIGTNGTGFAVLKSFSTFGSLGTNSDGGNPVAGLTISGNMLYGTSVNGGGYGQGDVFGINTNGSGFTVLKSFSLYTDIEMGDVDGQPNLDGKNPYAGLLLSGNTLYGTTIYGGATGEGVIFSVLTNGTDYTVLTNFECSDAVNPAGELAVSGNILYGVTENGGSGGSGSLFQVNMDGTGYQRLKDFGPVGGQYEAEGSILTSTNNDGAEPAGVLLANGVLYGLTMSGGTGGAGTVFQINSDGTGYTVLRDFSPYQINANDAVTNSDGEPTGLMLVNNTLYGTAYYGPQGGGLVFAMNTDGTGFVILKSFDNAPLDSQTYSFTNDDGAYPSTGLSVSGGTVYGTTRLGMSDGYGSVFKVNTDGTGFATLYTFTNGSDGANPQAGPIVSGNVLYGTAGGGSLGSGTLYKLNIDGSGFTVLHSFTNTEGAGFEGQLLLTNGVLYGTTFSGGLNDGGAVFEINTDGTGFVVLDSFSGLGSFGPNSGGGNPKGGLIMSGNMLYGTCNVGGNMGDGTVFSLTTNIPPAPPVLVTITSQPASFTLSSGGAANLSVSVGGTPPFTYQWYFDNSPISGANSSMYTINNFNAANVGVYYLVVSNAAGSATSQPFSIATMDLQMYAGIVIDGPLGSNYLVQASTNLTSGWTTLTNVALPSQPYIYIDYSSSSNRNSFYRAFPEP